MTREDANSLLEKLNRAKIGADKTPGTAAFGTDLALTSHVPFGIPTGIPELDLSIGRNGWPAGRIIELYGLQYSGKSTASYHAMAQAQRMGGLAILLDTERGFDPSRAEQCGMQADAVIVKEPNDIEEIFETIQFLLNEVGVATETNPIVIAIDSLTGVETRFNQARKFDEEQRVGEDARAIRRGLRKLNGMIAEKKVTVLLINHATALIGNMVGKKTDSAGGNAAKLLSSVRIEFQRIGNIYEGEKGDDRTRRGETVQLSIMKNRMFATGAPTVTVELTENGFDLYLGLFDAFEKIGAIKKQGVHYHFVPSESTIMKKDWRKFVDGYETPEGKTLGLEGFYLYFLRLAENDKWIKFYA